MVIKKHICIILALSALFSLIINLDLTRAIIFDDYWHTSEIGGGATAYYLSLINESSKGNWRLGSPYLLEWRDESYLYPALNINAAGLLKRISGLGIKMYSLFMDYGFIFVIMALVLGIFSMLFQFRYIGYLAATAYLFFPWHVGWARTLSPEVNFIPFALFLFFYFSRFSFWKREIGLGLFTGILFYMYPYYWTFALALLVVHDFWECWNQRKAIWEYMYKYLIIAALGSWYVVHLWQISQLPYYTETMVRIGALSSRWPSGWYTQAVLVASIALFFLLRRGDLLQRIDFNKITYGLFASLLVLNQQLITGMQLEFNSHYLPVILFFILAFWSGLIFSVIHHVGSQLKKRSMLAVLTILVFLFVGNKAFLAFKEDKWDSFGDKAPAVVNWFVKNNVKDKVIYAPHELNDEINVLTDNYLYFHGSQELQLMPTAELIDRFTHFDLANKNLTENLLGQQALIFGQTFKSSWQKDMVLNKIKAILGRKKFAPVPLGDYVDYDFAPIYKKRIHPDINEFIAYLDKYHVDYLVYKQEDRNSIYEDVPGKIVFEGDSYLIKKRN